MSEQLNEYSFKIYKHQEYSTRALFNVQHSYNITISSWKPLSQILSKNRFHMLKKSLCNLIMLNLNRLYSKHASIIPRFSSFTSKMTSYVVLLTYKWSELKWSENITQSCQILCNPMDHSPPGSSVHPILHARILEWVTISYSRGIFPTQGSKWCLMHCRQILYRLNHQGSPF